MQINCTHTYHGVYTNLRIVCHIIHSSLDGRGNWTSDGCQLAQINGSVVTCRCNHLTNFASLVVCTYISIYIIWLSCLHHSSEHVQQ